MAVLGDPVWPSEGNSELGFAKSGVREMGNVWDSPARGASSFGEIDAHGCNYQEESFPGLERKWISKVQD